MVRENFKCVEKSELTRLDISALPKKLPDLRDKTRTKDNLIANWLKSWISNDLASGKIQTDNLLPKKSDIASYLGVSVGTVQNAIRYVEDEGCLESKQRIGTMIRDCNNSKNQLRKQTSKREKVIYLLKNFIVEHEFQPGDALPSSREISKSLGSTLNTTRLALEHLSFLGIIASRNCRGNQSNWILKQAPSFTDKEISSYGGGETHKTLVNQVEEDLKEYIVRNHSVSDKLPAHNELSQILKVSIKTVHDGIKSLVAEGILCTRRGRYGTIIVKMPNDTNVKGAEYDIFASAADASFYNYQRVEKHIKLLIRKNHKVGDKLPPMGALAQELDVSSNTIRKALQNLSQQHILEFVRGRYGGTFISKMPDEKESATFKWLSINPEHAQAYKPVEV